MGCLLLVAIDKINQNRSNVGGNKIKLIKIMGFNKKIKNDRNLGMLTLHNGDDGGGGGR